MVSPCLSPAVAIHCCKAEQQQTQTQTQIQKQDANVLRPVRRRQRWQWSKGDGPGEYGGPPLEFNIRKFSWKDRDVDPISSNTEYIWNKEWHSHVSLEEKKPSTPSLPKVERERERTGLPGLVSRYLQQRVEPLTVRPVLWSDRKR